MTYLFTSESVSEGPPDKVAFLHLAHIGAKLETLEKEHRIISDGNYNAMNETDKNYYLALTRRSLYAPEIPTQAMPQPTQSIPQNLRV